ncbi:hypothetical protein QBC44DRAFT_323465, partial [Cladorrhinum sp. PSN332]
MVLSSAVTIGGEILKRSLEKRYSNYQDGSSFPDQDQPPTNGGDREPVPVLAQVQGVINIILFLPVILYIVYTLGSIFPTLAAIEDPLPAYESIPINDPLNSDAPLPGGNNEDPTIKKTSPPTIRLDADLESSGSSSSSSPATTWSSPVPVTSSLRKTHRSLTSLSGWTSLYRGLGYNLISHLIIGLASSPFYKLLGPQIAHLISLLLFTNLRTAWVHIVITPPSTQRWWKRIPSYKRTLVATYIPILCFWAALHSSIALPYIMAGLVGLSGVDGSKGQKLSGAKEVILSLLGIAAWLMSVGIVVPAETALLRVQASLLPEDEDTIIPFDRSFGGRVVPAVVSGKGFPGVRAALSTVSWPSWRRIVLQQIKICGVSFVLFFGMFVVMGLQA